MLWFMGDTHGNFKHILPALKDAKSNGSLPVAMVFLGDVETDVPFHELVRPWEALGTEAWFIHGNHDVDNPKVCANLLDDPLAVQRNLHGRVVELEGMRIAGLGGVFETLIWRPDAELREPRWLSYDDYAAHEKERLRYAEAGEEILAGRLLKARGAIFYDTYAELHGQVADILVTHEAPSCHPHGYQEIDDLARSLGATKTFHGHHHEHHDYASHRKSLGFAAYGVAYCGITDSHGRVILASD